MHQPYHVRKGSSPRVIQDKAAVESTNLPQKISQIKRPRCKELLGIYQVWFCIIWREGKLVIGAGRDEHKLQLQRHQVKYRVLFIRSYQKCQARSSDRRTRQSYLTWPLINVSIPWFLSFLCRGIKKGKTPQGQWNTLHTSGAPGGEEGVGTWSGHSGPTWSSS